MNIATVWSAPEVGLLKDKGHNMCMVFMCAPEKKNCIHMYKTLLRSAEQILVFWQKNNKCE